MPKYFHRIALCALTIALAACQQGGADSEAQSPTPQATPAPSSTGSPITTPSASETAADANNPVALIPEAEKGEKGARNVLLAWARALEQGDYATAYAQWDDGGARSGKSEKEFADYWRGFETIAVSVPEGQIEGAAGSLYYSVPATIVGKRANGKPYRLEGPVTLRRVNDVPGASAEQLRWHIESTDLKPAS